MKENGNKRGAAFVRGALVIAAGGFLAKVLGAAYRIPLVGILGGEGIGIYQMVFPLYCILLTVSSTGVPAGISKLTAGRSEEDARRVFRAALGYLALLGALGSLLMAALGGTFARLQGRPDARLSYLLLSPSVFLVSLISCYRGYWQGKLNMAPTAVSQIVEQAVKLGAGLALARWLLPDVARAAAGAALAVTVSELAALAYLALRFRLREPRLPLAFAAGERRRAVGEIVRITLPLALSALLIPFSQVIDSFLVVNLIGRYAENATALYGLFSGGVMSVVGLPVALAYGVAAAIIPVVSAACARGDEVAAREKSLLAVELTLFLAVPAALFCLRYADGAVDVLYGRLSDADRAQTVGLLRVSALSVVFLSVTQTLSSVLVGRGHPYVPVVTLAAGVAVKIAASVLLLSRPEFSIYGAAISMNLCYLVAGTANLVYIIKERRDALRLLRYGVLLVTASAVGVYGAALIPLAGAAGLFAHLAAAALFFLGMAVPLGLAGGGAPRAGKKQKAD